MAGAACRMSLYFSTFLNQLLPFFFFFWHMNCNDVCGREIPIGRGGNVSQQPRRTIPQKNHTKLYLPFGEAFSPRWPGKDGFLYVRKSRRECQPATTADDPAEKPHQTLGEKIQFDLVTLTTLVTLMTLMTTLWRLRKPLPHTSLKIMKTWKHSWQMLSQ